MPGQLERVPLVDAALALVLVGSSIVFSFDDPRLTQPWGALVSGVWAATVGLRTIAPLTMMLVASASAVVYALAFPVIATSLAAFVTILVATFSAGLNLTGRRLAISVVAFVTSTYVVQVATSLRPGGDTSTSDTYVSPLLLALPVLAGMLLRRSRLQTQELRRLSEALAVSRQAHADAAATAERHRIARELHDVISHAVTVMVVQAGAAEQLLSTDDPAWARVHAVRQAGKEALGELRRQLGLIREGASAVVDPLPGIAQIADLAQTGAVGVSVQTDGLAIPPGLELTAYRIVQEALTNAHRYAPSAPVQVTVDRCDRALRVVVEDEGAASGLGPSETGGGLGLRGMRERVEMYGGQLEAGPRPDRSGWRVSALLPMEG